jgi:ubiquitin-protein ligase
MNIAKPPQDTNRSKQLVYVLKEVTSAMKNPEISKTIQIIIDDNLSKYKMIVVPCEGLYKGITIDFELSVPINYPAPGNPIKVKCKTDIPHPNIFQNGELCLYYDGVGDIEKGYKETLESLLHAINYWTIHPGNYSENKIPTHIRQNVEQWKIKQQILKDKLDKLCYSRENYSKNLNKSLKQIKDIEKYFPKYCIQQSDSMKLLNRCVMTLGGNKQMALEKLENVVYHLMRDDQYTYSVCDLPQLLNSFHGVMIPEDYKQIKMTKLTKIIAPTTMNLTCNKIIAPTTMNLTCNKIMDDIIELYDTGISLYDFYKDIINRKRTTQSQLSIVSTQHHNEVTIFTNIVIESNYEMVIGMYVNNDGGLEFNILKKGSIIEIDMMMTQENYDPNIHIYIDKSFENSFDKQPYIKMSCSVLIYGFDMIDNFNNVCFKLNPFDNTSQYMKLKLQRLNYDVPSFCTQSTSSYGALTKEELEFLENDTMVNDILDKRDTLINNNDANIISENEIDQIFKSIGAFDTMNKYIASNNIDTGLKI